MHYNTILLNGIKISIINIPVTNLIALGIFSQDTKSSIIRIFLLNLIISFLNYIGDKNNFFKSKNFNGIKPLNKMNDINYNNFLFSKIYDTFLSIPIQIHFSRIIKKIFRRRALYIKDIHYKNYYLIDLSTNKIILSLETLHDKNNDKDPVFKTSNQEIIWNEIISHCHNLRNDYVKKNNMTFNGIDYQNFFVKVEYKVTYPRRNFIIKFLPLFNGMCIIHEYIQLKLSTFEGEEKKQYNEKNIIYGYDAYDNIFRNSDNRYFENEHYLLKQVHFFIIESLFCSNNTIPFFFVLNREPKIYFSKEILEIIDNELNDYLSTNNNNNNNNKSFIYNCPNGIINRIISTLYEEYMQINNNEKMLHKSSSAIPKNKKKNDLILKEIESLNKNKSLQITKNETLIFLFNSIQYNKNINPNDITLDLNDERISQIRITYNENDEFPSPRRSELIDKKNRPNSIRLSELLAENPSVRPSRETLKSNNSRDKKFPYDSESKQNEKSYDENYINNNEDYQRYSDSHNNNIINTSSNYKNEIITDDNIDNIISKSNNNENINYNNIDNYNNNIDNYNIYSNNNNNITDNYNNNYQINESNNDESINNKENENIINSYISKNKKQNNFNENINDSSFNNKENINDINNNNIDNFDDLNNININDNFNNENENENSNNNDKENDNYIDKDNDNDNDNDKYNDNDKDKDKDNDNYNDNDNDNDNDNYSNNIQNRNDNNNYNNEENLEGNIYFIDENEEDISNPSIKNFSSKKNLRNNYNFDESDNNKNSK